MAQTLAFRLQVENGQVVTAELKNIGEAGHRAFSRIKEGAESATRGMMSLAMPVDSVAKAFGQLKAAAGAYFTLQAAQETVKLADQWQLAGSRIAMSAGSMEAGQEVLQRLKDIAIETRQPLGALLQAYTLMSIPLKDLGYNADQSLQVIKSLANAILASGVGAVQAEAGFLQFSQALGRVLGGDELKSLFENTYRVPKAIADATGQAVSSLVELGSQWRITGRVAAESMLHQSGVLQKEASGIKTTVGQAVTNLRTEYEALSGEIFSSTGLTTSLVEAVNSVRAAISNPDFKTGLEVIGAGFAHVAERVAELIGYIGQFADVVGKQMPATESHFETMATAAENAFGDVVMWVREASGAVAWFGDKLAALKTLIPESTRALWAVAGGLPDAANAAGNRLQQTLEQYNEESAVTGYSGPSRRGAGGQGLKGVATAYVSPPSIFEVYQPKVKLGDPRDPPGTKESAAEKALRKAQETYVKNEEVINDLIRDMTVASNERDRFVNTAVERLNPGATEEQISQAKELAAAIYDQGKAMEALEAKRAGVVAMEMKANELNRQNATAAEQFAQKMQQLDALRTYGLNSRAYAEEARKASEEAAAAQEEADKRRLDSAANTYAQIEQIANTAFRGIASGMAEMLVEGEYNFEAFLDGMAKSIIEAGIQQALMGLFSMAAGGLGAPTAGAGAGSGGGFGSGASGGGNFFGLFHRGGTTSEPSGRRWMPYSAFDDAPKFHGGRMPSSDMAAIIRKDETILTPGQMSRLQPAGASPNVRVENKVNVINNSSARVETRAEPDGSTTIQIMEAALTRSIATPGSGPRRAVEEVVRRTR